MEDSIIPSLVSGNLFFKIWSKSIQSLFLLKLYPARLYQNFSNSPVDL